MRYRLTVVCVGNFDYSNIFSSFSGLNAICTIGQFNIYQNVFAAISSASNAPQILACSISIIHPEFAVNNFHMVDTAAGIALVAFIALFALRALCACRADFTLRTLRARCALLALRARCAGIPFIPLIPLGAFDIAQIEYGIVSQGDAQFACGGKGHGLYAYSVLAVSPRRAVSADDIAKIGGLTVCIGQHQMSRSIDFRFSNADAVRSFYIAQLKQCAVCQFYIQRALGSNGDVGNADALFASVALFTFGPILYNNAAKVDTVRIGKSQNQFAVMVDVRRRNTNAVLTRCTRISLITLFALDSILSVFADYNAQIFRFTV